MFEYTIVCAQDVVTFTQRVNATFDEGWRPVGGVSQSHTITQTGGLSLILTQALIREKGALVESTPEETMNGS